MNPKVTIIGAGLVGSLWAVLLRKRNIDVTVFEKRSDPRLSKNEAGRSINLVITSRGVHALEQAGLLQKALELAVPVYGRMIHAKTGELAYQPYGQENERNLSISRSALNQFLIEEAENAGAKIHFQHELSQIDLKKKTVSFSSGEQHSYDLLFGTDGAGSLVRKNLAKQYPDQVQESTEWLPADYKELFLPAPNSLDRKALHIWPRGSHMMMALANLDGSFTVTLYLPKASRPISFENIKNTKDVEDLFKNEFPDAIPLMPQYLSDFTHNPQGALGTVRCSKWVFENSVALMGDAAHAIVPFFGQGMNSGFEDCTNFLKILDRKNQNWSEALSEYDQTQRPNANAIADMAIENWYEMSEKVADPQFQLRKKVEGILEKKFPDLFKSRYGMVTYTLIPYHLVQKAGHLQDQIFAELLKDIKSPDEFSLVNAEALLKRIYEPFLKNHGII
ncbi:FAD-dependent oxidoreductase [Bdellovibrio sp. HCB337]|uniref:FAD-dependent oxidoreductase n=1 Tax=Bdellovibrio sp. HCB337 TaxID=3394358 RepID=UPI0039A7542E